MNQEEKKDMTRALTVAILGCWCGLAVLAAQGPAKPAETIEQLKVTIADQALTIARLTAQLNEARFELGTYEQALGATQRRQTDQAAVEKAQAALTEAQQAANAKQGGKK